MSSKKSDKFSHPEFPAYCRVGFVKSAHALHGEVFIALFAGRADWHCDRLALLRSGESSLSEFAVAKRAPHKKGLIVKFLGVDSREQSEALRGAQVYVPEEALRAEPGETVFLHQILGFELRGRDGAPLGRVTGFSSNGAQDLLEIEIGSGESVRLVPFVDDFIVDIDFDKRQLRMDLPPGLLSVEE